MPRTRLFVIRTAQDFEQAVNHLRVALLGASMACCAR
jgi:hypothetical protein